jgi:cell division protein FtsZ
MLFEIDHKEKPVAKLKVIGVGGAGGNAVNRMVQSGLQGVEFIALNTDAMALQKNQAEIKIQIGSKKTNGLGAGADPQVGMLSMQEDIERLRDLLEGADMVFIAAGMGGGTGTGAAPVVADLARSLGILTVAVVTKPFQWEGPRREKNALAGLEALRRAADTVIVVPNQKLLSVVEKGTPLRQAFMVADEVLSSATRGISEIILGYGEIQVDFADVRAVMAQGGDALMGSGRASGENRACIAMDRAIHSPLLENINIAGATGAVVNFSGGEDMSLDEINEAMNTLYEAVGGDANSNIIFGAVINPEMKDEVAITVIATGFGGSSAARPRPAHEPSRRPLAFPQAEAQKPATATAESLHGLHGTGTDFEYNHDKSLLPQSPHDKSLLPQSPKIPETRSRMEEGPLAAPGKVPFGSTQGQASGSRPVARSAFVPAPRPSGGERGEERPALQETGTAANRSNNLFSGLFGNPKGAESEPDIDYETPAFLRNQAD